MSANSDTCIFCNIISGKESGDIHYQDDELVVFSDIKPATKFHFLAVPKEHIRNISSLTAENKLMIKNLIYFGKKVVEDKGGDVNDIRLGFHCPPFNSVSHLHLHVISPVSEMSFISRMVFKPNTWWFSTVEQILEKLENSNNLHKL